MIVYCYWCYYYYCLSQTMERRVVLALDLALRDMMLYWYQKIVFDRESAPVLQCWNSQALNRDCYHLPTDSTERMRESERISGFIITWASIQAMVNGQFQQFFFSFSLYFLLFIRNKSFIFFSAPVNWVSIHLNEFFNFFLLPSQIFFLFIISCIYTTRITNQPATQMRSREFLCCMWAREKERNLDPLKTSSIHSISINCFGFSFNKFFSKFFHNRILSCYSITFLLPFQQGLRTIK